MYTFAMQLVNMLSGWAKMPMADGIVLVPQEGPPAGGIRIHERCRPLRRFSAILTDIIAGLPEHHTSLQIGPLQRLVTHEGEHAGLITLTAKTQDGGPAERTIGIILGDDSYAMVDGAVIKPERFAEVRQMVQLITEGFFLGLGDQRRRRYFFTPPSGWRGLGRVHTSRYYHPQYPREPAIITVHDTRPATVTVSEVTDRLLFQDFTGGLERDPPAPPTPIVARSGLAGQIVRISGHHPSGRHLAFVQATLVDSRFSYTIVLETTVEALPKHLPTLTEMALSIVPVPPRKTQSASALIAWAD